MLYHRLNTWCRKMLLWSMAAVVAVTVGVAGGCGKPDYDLSSPDAALESMHAMIVDGHEDLLVRVVHIEPRDITYDDGVTEASAIAEVLDKTGEMLGQLFRVAKKLRDRYPGQAENEIAAAASATSSTGRSGPDFGPMVGRFLADPFGLLNEQRLRLTAEDLGDGTAAVLLDGKPPFELGLLMRDVEGEWKIEVPLQLLQSYRPNTREEWSVVASMMRSIENSLIDFEKDVDAGKFRDLAAAGQRAGRLLGESVVVQSLIYASMKRGTGNGSTS